MVKSILKHYVIIALILLLSGAAHATESIRFSVLPFIGKVALQKQFAPFGSYLAQISGQNVSQRFFDDYRDVLTALLNDEVDMAFLGPLPYLTLSKKDPSFIPIGQFVNSHGESTYTCALVTYDCMTGDSAPQTPQKIALTQPYSTCGYLMTESLLTSLGLSLTTTPYEYIGRHDECALRVIRKEVDLAGMKFKFWQNPRRYRVSCWSPIVEPFQLK
ncbi:MAG: PhnD/SsuA/transferrin family substrate-binding protein [Deltaproteobacteria bacterium]|nr:PhnD/SsuA/transferrin family substrate-binding protein [Deltaproteobacteria bacterium]